MDKRTVLAFVIIGVILIIWLMWSSNMQKQQVKNLPPKDTTKTTQVDTTKIQKKEKV